MCICILRKLGCLQPAAVVAKPSSRRRIGVWGGYRSLCPVPQMRTPSDKHTYADTQTNNRQKIARQADTYSKIHRGTDRQTDRQTD